MKLFPYDYLDQRNSEAPSEIAKSEYPINHWLDNKNGHPAYILSAYLYDSFVVFLYVYDHSVGLPDHSDYPDLATLRTLETNKDMIMAFQKSYNSSTFDEIEINSLKSQRSGSRECVPITMPDFSSWDADTPYEVLEESKKHYENAIEEYDYLYEFVKSRLPDSLKTAELAFIKETVTFSEAIDKIEDLVIYSQCHETRYHFIDKPLSIPYGACNIKIPYSANDENSYLILKELKIVDLLEEFDKRYDEYKEAHEAALKDWEERGRPENQHVMDLDEARALSDRRLLTITYLKPEETRSFEFYLTNYLKAERTPSERSAIGYIFMPDIDERMEDGLYKGIAVLGEMEKPSEKEYEILLLRTVDNTTHERKLILEIKSLSPNNREIDF